jgi:hypothetical protein
VALLAASVAALLLVRRLRPLIELRDRLLAEDREILGIEDTDTDKEDPDEPRG